MEAANSCFAFMESWNYIIIFLSHALLAVSSTLQESNTLREWYSQILQNWFWSKVKIKHVLGIDNGACGTINTKKILCSWTQSLGFASWDYFNKLQFMNIYLTERRICHLGK